MKFRLGLLSIILPLILIFSSCSNLDSTQNIDDVKTVIGSIDKLIVLCNNIEGTSRWEPTGTSADKLKNWINKLEYEEYDFLSMIDGTYIDTSYSISIDDDAAKSIQYVIDTQGDHYLYINDKWNKVLNPSQPPVDTSEFIRAELLGLNDIDNMSLGELREVLKVLSQNPNTEQSLKIKETLGFSIEDIINGLEGTNENNALTISGSKISVDNIRDTLKNIGITNDTLDFRKYANFDFFDAANNISTSFSKSLGSLGPLGTFMGELASDIWDSTTKNVGDSYKRSYDLIKEAISKKTGTPIDEVNADTILKYLEDSLNKAGYENEDSYSVLSDLLDTIYSSMTPDEQQLLRMYNNFTSGVGSYELDEIDTKTIFTELIQGIRKELPDDQKVILDMFTSVEEVIENYDYTSNENRLTDEMLDSLKEFFNPEQQSVLNMFKVMT